MSTSPESSVLAAQGKLTKHLGGATRTFTWKSPEVMVLEEQLGCDPLVFLARGSGETRFLCMALFVGLTKKTRSDEMITPAKIASWLDREADLNRRDLSKEILYVIARGKPKKESERMVKALDEAFEEASDDAEGGDAAGPTG